MDIVNRLIQWTIETFSPLGPWGLFILAFIEASFFPIPPDLLLIVLTLDQPSLWWLFALVATIGSVLGGGFGYGIGHFGKKTLLTRLVSEERIQKVHGYFERWDAWAVFIAGFTPIPFKIFTIGAGIFQVDFKRFLVAALGSRGLRFGLVCLFISLFGDPMVTFINDYFDIISLVAVAVGITVYLIYRKVKHGAVWKLPSAAEGKQEGKESRNRESKPTTKD